MQIHDDVFQKAFVRLDVAIEKQLQRTVDHIDFDGFEACLMLAAACEPLRPKDAKPGCDVEAMRVKLRNNCVDCLQRSVDHIQRCMSTCNVPWHGRTTKDIEFAIASSMGEVHKACFEEQLALANEAGVDEDFLDQARQQVQASALECMSDAIRTADPATFEVAMTAAEELGVELETLQDKRKDMQRSILAVVRKALDMADLAGFQDALTAARVLGTSADSGLDSELLERLKVLEQQAAAAAGSDEKAVLTSFAQKGQLPSEDDEETY